MRASDSWFPLLLPLFGMIRHRKLAGPTFLPFQLSRHQRTSSHCWMLSSWIWTRGSLAATATHFATAWHCFVQGLLHPTSTKAVDELLPVVRDLQAICLFFFVSFAEDFVKIRWFLSVLSQNSSICLAFFCGRQASIVKTPRRKWHHFVLRQGKNNSFRGGKRHAEVGIPNLPPLSGVDRIAGSEPEPSILDTKNSSSEIPCRKTSRTPGGWWPLMVCEFEP